jgi:hypothetical protein
MFWPHLAGNVHTRSCGTIGGLRPHGVEEPLEFMVFAGCEVGKETLVGNVHGCFGGFQQCPALVAG